MVPSDADMVSLGVSVEAGFLECASLYQRVNKVELVVPASIMPDVVRWREMRMRHKKGDHRHTEGENLATRSVAQWTLDNYLVLRGQPVKKLVWKD
jgi:hypothetical protein